MSDPGSRLELILSPPPHIHSPLNRDRMFHEVLLALTPTLLIVTGAFGIGWLIRLVAVTVGALLAGWLSDRILRQDFNPLEPAQLVTVTLLSLSLPPLFPPIMATLAAFLAVFFGRNVFGGIGRNTFNPAMFGWAAVALLFPGMLNRGSLPVTPFGSDWLSGDLPMTAATPLVHSATSLLTRVTRLDGGTPAELSLLAVLLGGGWLLYRGIVRWQIPFAVFTGALLGGLVLRLPLINPTAAFSDLFCGALPFAAFFIATDPVSSPVRPSARLVYGLAIGVLTVLLRLHTSLPEGVAFAVLTANLLTPLLDNPNPGGHR